MNTFINQWLGDSNLPRNNYTNYNTLLVATSNHVIFLFLIFFFSKWTIVLHMWHDMAKEKVYYIG